MADMALKVIARLSLTDDDDDSVITTLLIALRALFKESGLIKDDDLFPTLRLVEAFNEPEPTGSRAVANLSCRLRDGLK